MQDAENNILATAANSIRVALKKNFGFLAGCSTLSQIIGDVLTPIAPFSKYIFIGSIISVVILVLLFLIKKTSFKYMAEIFTFAVISLLIGGVFFFTKSEASSSKGVIATNFIEVERIQKALNIIGADIEKIKYSQEKVLKSVSGIENVLGKINTSTENIENTMGGIVKGFELTTRGNIISNPTSAEHYYINAIKYEDSGDNNNAVDQYIKCIKSDKQNYIDPYFRLGELLKNKYGRSGAYREYNSLVKADNLSAELGSILLMDGSVLYENLTRLSKTHKKYLPAYYYLWHEYYEKRIGGEEVGSFDEKEILKTIIGNGNREYEKWFMDKKLCKEHIDLAKHRLNELQ